MQKVGTWIRLGGAVAFAMVAVFLAASVAQAEEAPPELWTRCTNGGGAGQCSLPRGIATDPANGNLYLADQDNRRVVELDVWGEFVRTFGWRVNRTKVEASAPMTEQNRCPVDSGDVCQAGSQALVAGAIPGGFGSPQGVAIDSAGGVFIVDRSNSRVQKFDREGHFLLTFGRDVASSGPGNTGGNEQQTVTVKATAGSFTLSPTTATGASAITSGSAMVTGVTTTLGSFQVGDAVSAPGIPAGTTIAAVGAGTLTLSANATLTRATDLTATETTAAIPFNASAAQLQASLEALPGVGAGGVTVSGGPGDDTGSSPYTVTFSGGVFKGNDVAQMSANPAGLSAGEKTATVATTVPGGGTEVCKPAAGDVCKAGSEGTGLGQFGALTVVGSYIAIDTKGTIPATGDDALYIGDPGRIQRCNTSGEGCVALPDPEGLIAAGQFIRGLAIAPGSNLYVSFVTGSGGGAPKADVLGLDPASGALECKAAVGQPWALAASSAGELYVVDGNKTQPPNKATIRKFGDDCKEDGEFAFASEGLEESTGIATGEVCFSEGLGLYVSNSVGANSFIRALGPPPDNPECASPPAVPPQISAQYAISVGAQEASVGAQINPRFWSGSLGETHYFVQYATATCIEASGWESECVKEHPAPPGAKLISGVVNEPVRSAGVLLSGLSPATKYVYRFLAESDGAPGEAVAGVGGTPSEEGKASTFTTFALPQAAPSCANEALRSGASAKLPDCRAHEMVSPIDKEGGDIAVRGPTRMDKASTDGNKLTYSSYRAFGDAQSAPYSSQYIASRHPLGSAQEGWQSEGISPPQEGEPLNLEPFVQTNPFEAFTADLDEAWLQTAFEPPLALGAVEGFNNVYHRDNESGAYEACTTSEPPNLPRSLFDPQLMGVTSDGSGRAVFAALDQLTPDASPVPNRRQLYLCDEEELTLVSVLPDGGASGGFNVVGTANAFRIRGRATLATGVSEDAERVYWTATGVNESGPGAVYLRSNVSSEESARTLGTAKGTGNLIGPAQGTGGLINKAKDAKAITSLRVASGGFAIGQEIADEEGGTVVQAGTTITGIEEEALSKKEQDEGKPRKFKLTISKDAIKTVTGAGVKLAGIASKVVSGASATSGAFAVGQEIAAAGLPIATTIQAMEETGAGVFKLTLSAAATKTETAGAIIPGEGEGESAELEALSPCSEAQTKACTIALTGDGRLFGATNARFWAALPDGSAALFSEGATLYRFELAEALAGEAPEAIAPEVTAILGQSTDLGRVYFLSEAQIDGEGEADKPNLYLYEAGEGGGEPTYRFIATLSGRDTLQESGAGAFSPANPVPIFHTARVTPGGETLAFMSNSGPLAEAVAGYDNTDASSPTPCGEKGGICDAEIYLYEASSEELACVSCNPGGARPAGRNIAGEGSQLFSPALLPTWETSLHPRTPLSADGQRLFFESYEALVLADTNGAADVYQWERASSGNCEEGMPRFVESAGGCIDLISSGKSPTDSEFIDASPSGDDVFFTTAESLVEVDPGSIDIYDARTGGGFPSPPPPPAQCEGEACQSPPAPPEDQTPASSTYQGPGNLSEGSPPKPCPKGKHKVRSKGKTRCVPKKKKQKAKHKRARRHEGRAAR